MWFRKKVEPRIYCRYCGCPLEDMKWQLGRPYFDPMTGKGTVKLQAIRRCLKCREKDDWLTEDSYTWEYGPIWTEEIESECG